MSARPQVVTLTAGAQSVTLDTRTVAQAVASLDGAACDGGTRALLTLTDTLRDLCGPDHLAAVLRDDGTTTDTE